MGRQAGREGGRKETINKQRKKQREGGRQEARKGGRKEGACAPGNPNNNNLKKKGSFGTIHSTEYTPPTLPPTVIGRSRGKVVS